MSEKQSATKEDVSHVQSAQTPWGGDTSFASFAVRDESAGDCNSNTDAAVASTGSSSSAEGAQSEPGEVIAVDEKGNKQD